METFDFGKLVNLKNMLVKSNIASSVNSNGKTEEYEKDSFKFESNKCMEALEEMDKELVDTLAVFESKFLNLEKEMEKMNVASECDRKK